MIKRMQKAGSLQFSVGQVFFWCASLTVRFCSTGVVNPARDCLQQDDRYGDHHENGEADVQPAFEQHRVITLGQAIGPIVIKAAPGQADNLRSSWCK